MMMMIIMSNHGKMTIEASCRAWLATRAHAKIPVLPDHVQLLECGSRVLLAGVGQAGRAGGPRARRRRGRPRQRVRDQRRMVVVQVVVVVQAAVVVEDQVVDQLGGRRAAAVAAAGRVGGSTLSAAAAASRTAPGCRSARCSASGLVVDAEVHHLHAQLLSVASASGGSSALLHLRVVGHRSARCSADGGRQQRLLLPGPASASSSTQIHHFLPLRLEILATVLLFWQLSHLEAEKEE